MAPKPISRNRKRKGRPNDLKGVSQDTNAPLIIPESREEREIRRRQLREELIAQQPPSKASSKKKKRLEKYIDVKLRKEENLDLIKKLASHKIDTSLLKSSKTLGRRTETKREHMSRALQEKRAGIDDAKHQDILFEQLRSRVDDDDVSPSDGEEPEQPISEEQLVGEAPTFGSGLKRPLTVSLSGMPIIKKRRKLKSIYPEKSLRMRHNAEVYSNSESESESQIEPGSEPESDVLSASETDWEGFETSSVESDDAGKEGDSNSLQSIDHPESDEGSIDRSARASAFKSWADDLRNKSKDFQPSTMIDQSKLAASQAAQSPSDKWSETTKENQDPPKKTLSIMQPLLPNIDATQKTVYNVAVQRSEQIESARLALPVVAEEQKIMESIKSNVCVVICGATGSGKTTQIPQFLFEAGYGDPNGPTPGMIGITQPRRIAAVSMAKRVATELGDQHRKVAHQIRFDSSVSRETAIKFMTDGVLLREISQDFALSKYSVVIIDEAHQRSVNTDLLIGMLSRIIEIRSSTIGEKPPVSGGASRNRPLKLIIMSATPDLIPLTQNDFLFRKVTPSIINVEGRQFPVTIHFARQTKRDYVDETVDKVCRGHRKLPPGGMLVFLTGKEEILHVMKRLKEKFDSTDSSVSSNSSMKISAATASVECEDFELNGRDGPEDDFESDSESEIRGVDNDEEQEFNLGEDPPKTLKVHILPLHSQLSNEQQMRVFEPPPEDSRLIVLATNVAETSLTIPGIRYVFDCGRSKQRRFERATGVQSFEISWISKASAGQRTGRAGRTGPGHCYRLYSSAVYERDFDDFAEPEILSAPLEGVILQLRSLGIPSIDSFPFPTSPDKEALATGERLLEKLGAIRFGKVTYIGSQLVIYPLSPRLSRIIQFAQTKGLVGHALGLVAVLAMENIFIPEAQIYASAQLLDSDNSSDKLKKAFNEFHAQMSRIDRASDALKMLCTLQSFSDTSGSVADDFRKYTNSKMLQEAVRLRKQIHGIVAATQHTDLSKHFTLPTSKQIEALRCAVAAGYIDRLAIRADLAPEPPQHLEKARRAIEQPYLTLFASLNASDAEFATELNLVDRERSKYVFIHPSSVLAHMNVEKLPAFVVYSHLSRSHPSDATGHTIGMTRMHPLTPISSDQLLSLVAGTPLCEDGKPRGKIESLPRSAEDRERRAVWTIPYLKGEAGQMSWPLPPVRRVVQVRLPKLGWIDENLV